MSALRGEPDAEALAALTGRMVKQPDVDPVLGLVARPAITPETQLHGPRTGKTTAVIVPRAAEQPASVIIEPEPAPERKEKIGGWSSVKGTYERLRRAQWHTQTQPDGWESISALVDAVVVAEVERLEREHNGGEPFPEIPAGRMKRSSRR